MSKKEFEEILDKATIKMGDYSTTYEFFRLRWENLLKINSDMTLREAIEIKNMYDLTHNKMKKNPMLFKQHGGGKKATKKKKRRK